MVDTWLLASSCRQSRRKRASAFFFHFEASPTPVPISTAFWPKLTFFGPLEGLAEDLASFVNAPAILLAFWVEAEGPAGRAGASGVGGTTAGEGLVFGGFWPAVFLLRCTKSQIRTSQIRYGVKSKEYLPYFRSGSLIVAECSGTVSRWPHSAGDGWREITLLPNPHTCPPEPRTPWCTIAMGSSAIFSSSATFCLLGDEDVSSSSSGSSFVQG
jgi:hypothetical protein